MSFDWEMYSALNPDLNKARLVTKQQIEKHFIRFAKAENRVYDIYQVYQDFNPEIYREIYSDLKRMNKRELELHWLRHGRYEGRIYDNLIKNNLSITSEFGVNINTKYTVGIAVTIYSTEKTPVQRIDWSIQCIQSIVNNLTDVLIILLIDEKIINRHLEALKNIATNNSMVKIYRNRVNYGIAKSKNICIKLLENENIDLFCLLDDDIFIKKSPIQYIIDVFKQFDIPLLTNFHTEYKNTKFNINGFSFVRSLEFFGNLLVIPMKYLKKYGYFNVFPIKWGAEHIEITKRYLKDTKYNNICGDFTDYIINSKVIDGVDTLHMHSLDVNSSEAEPNVRKMKEYLKNIKYVPLDNNYSTIRIL
jgi:hypothetical protein